MLVRQLRNPNKITNFVPLVCVHGAMSGVVATHGDSQASMNLTTVAEGGYPVSCAWCEVAFSIHTKPLRCQLCSKCVCSRCCEYITESKKTCDICVSVALHAKLDKVPSAGRCGSPVKPTCVAYDVFGTSHVSDSLLDVYYLDGPCTTISYTEGMTIGEVARLIYCDNNMIALYEVKCEIGQLQEHSLLPSSTTLAELFTRWAALSWYHAKIVIPVYLNDCVVPPLDASLGTTDGIDHTLLESELLATMSQIKELTRHDPGPEILLPEPPIMVTTGTNTAYSDQKTVSTATDVGDLDSITTSASTQWEVTTSDCATEPCWESTPIYESAGTNTEVEVKPEPTPRTQLVDASCDAYCAHLTDCGTDPDLILSGPVTCTSSMGTDVVSTICCGTDAEPLQEPAVLVETGCDACSTHLVDCGTDPEPLPEPAVLMDTGCDACSTHLVDCGTDPEPLPEPVVLVDTGCDACSTYLIDCGTDAEQAVVVETGCDARTTTHLVDCGTDSEPAPEPAVLVETGCDAHSGPVTECGTDPEPLPEPVVFVETGCDACSTLLIDCGTDAQPTPEPAVLVETGCDACSTLLIDCGTDALPTPEPAVLVETGCDACNTRLVDCGTDAEHTPEPAVLVETGCEAYSTHLIDCGTDTEPVPEPAVLVDTGCDPYCTRLIDCGTDTEPLPAPAVLVETGCDPCVPHVTDCGTATEAVMLVSSGTDALVCEVRTASTDVDRELVGPATHSAGCNTEVAVCCDQATDAPGVIVTATVSTTTEFRTIVSASTNTDRVGIAHVGTDAPSCGTAAVSTETEHAYTATPTATTATNTTLRGFVDCGSDACAAVVQDQGCDAVMVSVQDHGTTVDLALTGPIMATTGCNTNQLVSHSIAVETTSATLQTIGTDPECTLLMSAQTNTDAADVMCAGTSTEPTEQREWGTDIDLTLTGPCMVTMSSNTAHVVLADSSTDANTVEQCTVETWVDAGMTGPQLCTTGSDAQAVVTRTWFTNTLRVRCVSAGTATERTTQASVGTDVEYGMTGPLLTDSGADANCAEQRTVETSVEAGMTGPQMHTTGTGTETVALRERFTNTPRVRCATMGTETTATQHATVATEVECGMTGPEYHTTGVNTPQVTLESVAVGTEPRHTSSSATSTTVVETAAQSTETVPMLCSAASTEVDRSLVGPHFVDADVNTVTLSYVSTATEMPVVSHGTASTEIDRALVGPALHTIATSTESAVLCHIATGTEEKHSADCATLVDTTLTGPALTSTGMSTDTPQLCSTACDSYAPLMQDQTTEASPEQCSTATNTRVVNCVESGTDAVCAELVSFGTDIDAALVGPQMCTTGTSPALVELCDTGCDANTAVQASVATDVDLALTGPVTLSTATNTPVVAYTEMGSDAVRVAVRTVGFTVDKRLTGPKMFSAGVSTTAVELVTTGCNADHVRCVEIGTNATCAHSDASAGTDNVECVTQGTDPVGPVMVDRGCDADHEPDDWHDGNKGYCRRRDSVRHHVAVIETCLHLQRSRSTSNLGSPSSTGLLSPESPSNASIATLPEHEEGVMLPYGTNIPSTAHLHRLRTPHHVPALSRKIIGSTYSSPRLGSPGTGSKLRSRLSDKVIAHQHYVDRTLSASPVTPASSDRAALLTPEVRRRGSADSGATVHSGNGGSSGLSPPLSSGTSKGPRGGNGRMDAFSPVSALPGLGEAVYSPDGSTTSVPTAGEKASPASAHDGDRRSDTREAYHAPASAPAKPGHSDWSRARRVLL
jgi:hypothetical protein